MSVIDTIREFVGDGKPDPTTYECPECGDRFEKDLPPERVICSACGNKDLERADG